MSDSFSSYWSEIHLIFSSEEFEKCLEYNTDIGYGYREFFYIDDIGHRRADDKGDRVEVKIFVKTLKNAHILFSPTPNNHIPWNGTEMYYEICTNKEYKLNFSLSYVIFHYCLHSKLR